MRGRPSSPRDLKFQASATRHEALERNFQRFFVWSLVGGSLAILGGLAQGHLREVLWALVVAIDLFSTAVGFYVPGLGRTATREWNIDGAHAAERIQAFVMIALGESIVIIGASLTGFKDLSLAETMAIFWPLSPPLPCGGSISTAARPSPHAPSRHPLIPAGWPGPPFIGRRCRWSPGDPQRCWSSRAFS
jgi:hypothetical protein